ncbi:sugar phosphate isomerase/epimerase family protein [Spirosoma sp. KUDC1026]|uniref:sugar phosphate isomerase/epimerase family protein n=1 Tax=Spirosoma sp. KUDC1026 TaxID=2745947 RepID=UPI00159BD51B|nr:sugar phosphate isomerase/epimerase [Spirosoma sp. KUDC1026]QKZ12261.1 sugar phosphate isomerase/epimerase [Spirosoma sp. KUDC1026]
MKSGIIKVLILCAAIVSTTQAQPFGKTVRKTPGIVSYTLRDSFGKDVPGTLDKIKAMGITDLELSNLFGKTAAEMRALLNERGIKCSSYGIDYKLINEQPDSVLQRAKTLGAQYVRVAWIPHQGKATPELIQQTATDFNKFGKLAKEQGLTFCYHNHGYEFQPYEGGTLFDLLAKQTNPEYVSFEMDIAWTYLPGQNPVTLLNKYPKRFRLMHLKDVRKGVAGNDEGKLAAENSVALGTGQLDMPAILKAAQKAAVDHLYIEDESPAAEQQVPQSLSYLKQL